MGLLLLLLLVVVPFTLHSLIWEWLALVSIIVDREMLSWPLSDRVSSG